MQSQYNTTYAGLLELEASLPAELTNPRITRPPKHSRLKGGTQHADDRYQMTLESVLLNLKHPKDKAERSLRFQKRIPTPPKRGPVGQVEVPPEGVDARFQAALLLQRIIRGRAEQAAMFEGKDRRKELIAELRTTHALQSAQQEIKREEQQCVICPAIISSCLPCSGYLEYHRACSSSIVHRSANLSFAGDEIY